MSHSKTLLVAVVMILPFAAAPATAQEQPDLHAAIVQAYELARDGTRQILRDEMMLTAAEEEKFWPLYDRYTSELKEVEDRYLGLIKAFLQRYDRGILNDEDAGKIIDAGMSIREDRMKIRRKYLRDFRKILPEIKVLRLFQLENKVQAEVDSVLAVAIPLADPR